MQDSSQVCISKGIQKMKFLDYRSQSKTQLLMPKQKPWISRVTATKSSNFIVECYLDIPVVDQFIFYLMLVNAKNKYAHQLQRVIAEKPELSQIEALQLANNFASEFSIHPSNSFIQK